ncbi:EthD family reductase [Actibacterium sp. 188UL27-1]|uniref:EthD family reductase n=1 Tax=Actibacterium sp. 188UL27-1 TaxID=2786961 RepID=UPI001957BDB7|nr:EthD family reductase [Actibacterium sp. 188UL27-1]MBM7068321.1 EthD family reductase [Actibacterium sp. 188UL27-1]
MVATIQAVYPVKDGVTFDFDYYMAAHIPLVRQHFEPHGLTEVAVSKGLAGGPDTPPGYFAIATMRFADMAQLEAAIGAAAPVLADIPEFTNGQPDLLIGEEL